MKTEKDQLWAKVLGLKYANPNRCCFGTWASIKRGKHIFKQGTKWNMGSDSGLSFLHDEWLIEGKLWSLISGPLLRDEDKIRISDMVHKGRWNVNFCSFMFPLEILLRIRDVPPPKTANLMDTFSWGLSPAGEFERKFAYWLAKGSRDQTYGFAGQWIWKTDTLPKIQCFV